MEREVKYKCTQVPFSETRYEVILTYDVWQEDERCYGQDRHRFTCSTIEKAKEEIAEDRYAKRHLAGRVFVRSSVIVREVKYTTIVKF